MNQYETTFIVTPVLTDEGVKETVKQYTDFLKSNGAELVEEDHWGLKKLAYPIQKKTTGIYHHVEFKADTQFIGKLELALKRDENILRFLTVRCDKYAIKYNDDKRAGLVGRNKTVKTENNVQKSKA